MLLYTNLQNYRLVALDFAVVLLAVDSQSNGECMLLIGRDLSPFVRRCATVFNLLELPYERKSVATEEDGDYIREHNPLGRVPALLLGSRAERVDDKTDIGAPHDVIVDSTANYRLCT